HEYEWAPERAVAGHRDALRGPREPGEVVQHDVEPHPRRGAVGRRVAQKGRAEALVGELADVALDEHLALRVGRLRVHLRRLVENAAVADAVHAAGRRVDEAPDTGL